MRSAAPLRALSGRRRQPSSCPPGSAAGDPMLGRPRPTRARSWVWGAASPAGCSRSHRRHPCFVVQILSRPAWPPRPVAQKPRPADPRPRHRTDVPRSGPWLTLGRPCSRPPSSMAYGDSLRWCVASSLLKNACQLVLLGLLAWSDRLGSAAPSACFFSSLAAVSRDHTPADLLASGSKTAAAVLPRSSALCARAPGSADRAFRGAPQAALPSRHLRAAAALVPSMRRPARRRELVEASPRPSPGASTPASLPRLPARATHAPMATCDPRRQHPLERHCEAPRDRGRSPGLTRRTACARRQPYMASSAEERTGQPRLLRRRAWIAVVAPFRGLRLFAHRRRAGGSGAARRGDRDARRLPAGPATLLLRRRARGGPPRPARPVMRFRVNSTILPRARPRDPASACHPRPPFVWPPSSRFPSRSRPSKSLLTRLEFASIPG